MSRRGWMLFLALGVIWGVPYLLIKVAVREVSPQLLVLMRTGAGALLLLPLAASRGALRPVLAHWKAMVAYTAAEIGVPWYLLFNAERRLSSSLSALIVAAVPLVSAVLAAATGTDRLSARRLGGLAVGFGGVAALVGLDVSHADLLAALSLAGVAVGYALGPWILSRHLAELPSLGVVAGSLALGAVVYAPIAAFALPARGLSGSVVASVVLLIVLCTVIAFLVFFALITEVGPVRATLITYVNPAIAVLLGVSVLGEHFGAGTVAGFVLIVGGCLLAARNDGRRDVRHDGRRTRPAGEGPDGDLDDPSTVDRPAASGAPESRPPVSKPVMPPVAEP
ncbi:MAG: DMT family transporter [Acidimicrobiales bacterium]